MANNRSKMRVAIIGCGPSGMAIMTAFAKAQDAGEEIPTIVCFEKQSTIGGMWNYSWRTGLDEFGENVHNSMYRGLWTNVPKEFCELPYYTFDDHFKKPISSYFPRSVFRDYLVGKANKFKITERFTLHFSTVTTHVKEIDSKFSVSYKDLNMTKTKMDIFDYVVVASGHYSVPNIPSFPGLETFPGRIIHVHDYRNPEEFKGQIVLLIGSSTSAVDVALQGLKYGVKKSIISYRRHYHKINWPESVVYVPGLVDVVGRECTFNNGEKHEVDSIIFCTGYNYHFPFMHDDLTLSGVENEFIVEHLYKGVSLDRNPNVFYMAMQRQAFTLPLIDAEAWFVRDCILGKITIPDQEERQEDIRKWMNLVKEKNSLLEKVEVQGKFIKMLTEV